MVLRRGEPFGELSRLEQDMDRLWGDLGSRFREWPALWRGEESGVPLDVYGDKDHLTVKATIPGVKPEEVDITITSNSLTIKGKSKEEDESNEENYLLRERAYGSFGRTFNLPEGLNTDKAEASFDNGVLTITIPKKEDIKPKNLKVEVSRAIEGEKK